MTEQKNSNQESTLQTNIWLEEPQSDNPYAASVCYCSGYDVYGELLGNISWIDYLYLLFKLELPTKIESQLLNNIAVAIANPGIRDHSVRAAMNAGAGGSTRASALIAAIAVGAGNLNGGRDVLQMIRLWCSLDTDIDRWRAYIEGDHRQETEDSWPLMEHIAGFDPNGVSRPKPVVQTLSQLASLKPKGKLAWLQAHVTSLEQLVGYPLAMSGVIATALADLEFSEAQAEMLYLMLRLPGAAAHALEQEVNGWRKYPFFGSAVKPMEDSAYNEILTSWRNKP
jgi:citrate synthase